MSNARHDLTVEELEQMSDEQLTKLGVTLTDMLGISSEREEELNEIIKNDDDFTRVDQYLKNLEFNDDLSDREKIYIAYAFGSIQGQNSVLNNMPEELKILFDLPRILG